MATIVMKFVTLMHISLPDTTGQNIQTLKMQDGRWLSF